MQLTLQPHIHLPPPLSRWTPLQVFFLCTNENWSLCELWPPKQQTSLLSLCQSLQSACSTSLINKPDVVTKGTYLLLSLEAGSSLLPLSVCNMAGWKEVFSSVIYEWHRHSEVKLLYSLVVITYLPYSRYLSGKSWWTRHSFSVDLEAPLFLWLTSWLCTASLYRIASSFC